MEFGNFITMKSQLAEMDETNMKLSFHSIKNGRATLMMIHNFVKYIKFENFLTKSEKESFKLAKDIPDDTKKNILKTIIKNIKMKLGVNIIMMKPKNADKSDAILGLPAGEVLSESSKKLKPEKINELEAEYYISNFSNKERLQDCIIKILQLNVTDFDKDYSEIENQ